MKNHQNDCIWREECKDIDDIYCCEKYREKAQGKCFVRKTCPWSCCK